MFPIIISTVDRRPMGQGLISINRPTIGFARLQSSNLYSVYYITHWLLSINVKAKFFETKRGSLNGSRPFPMQLHHQAKFARSCKIAATFEVIFKSFVVQNLLKLCYIEEVPQNMYHIPSAKENTIMGVPQKIPIFTFLRHLDTMVFPL